MATRCITTAVENRNKLKRIYKKILRLTDKIPKESVYKVNTEVIVCHRLCILRIIGYILSTKEKFFENKRFLFQYCLKDSETVEDLENRIGCGSLKMLVHQAEAEYELCQKMILWKPWEPLIRSPSPFQWKWPL